MNNLVTLQEIATTAPSQSYVLPIIWFFLLGVLLIGYAILDGFDLGVGIIHPFISKTDTDRRLVINSIGPFWDGNEVWLVTFGGAMFAMFPMVYASVFSGFYTAFFLLLFCLILRAVSLEFRSKVENVSWRYFWDYGFFAGSILASLLFGVAIGNIAQGIALNSAGDFQGGLTEQIGVFPIAVGLLVIFLFWTHGGIYLNLKFENEFKEKIIKVVKYGCMLYLFSYLLIWSLVVFSKAHLLSNYKSLPYLYIIPVANFVVLCWLIFILWKDKYSHTNGRKLFFLSSFNIFLLILSFGLAICPYLVFDPINPSNSLTIFNSSSSNKTLTIGLIVALIGMPIVIAYTIFVHYLMRGKVKLDSSSY